MSQYIRIPYNITSITGVSNSSSLSLTITDGILSGAVIPGGVNHNGLANLTVGDPHTQYALLNGRAGGQTLVGGTAASDSLILGASSNFGTNTGTIDLYVGISDLAGQAVPQDWMSQGSTTSAFYSPALKSGNVFSATVGTGNFELFTERANLAVGFQPPLALLQAADGTTAFAGTNIISATTAVDTGAVHTGGGFTAAVATTNTQELGEVSGVFFTTSMAGSGLINNTYGSNGVVLISENGTTVDTARGYSGIVGSLTVGGSGTASIEDAAGAELFVFSLNGDLDVNNAVGVSAGFLSLGPTLTINNGFGVRVSSGNSLVTIGTSVYGMYIGDQSLYTGTYSHWNLYSVGATTRNYMQGFLGIGTSAPTSKLHIDSGATDPGIRLDGAGNIAASAGAATGNYARINIGGTVYKIALLADT